MIAGAAVAITAVAASSASDGGFYFADGGTNAFVFAGKVMVNGLDVTDRVIGDIDIEADENAARVVDIVLRLDAGTSIYLPEWTGKPVTVDFGPAVAGVLVDGRRLFGGVVDLPSIDLQQKTLTLRCVDGRADKIAALTKAEARALVPGYYSPAVFEESASVWLYVNDLLTTLPAALDVSPDGALRLTPWVAKSGPDYLFTDDEVIEDSLTLDLAERSGLTNTVVIEFGYRFPRIKAEGYNCNYDILGTDSFASYIINNKYILPREQVESAIKSAGATIESITWTALPTAAVPLVVGGSTVGAWIPNPATDPLLCTGWNAVVSFSYSQLIEERHTITVSCANSVAQVGEIKETMTGALEGKYPDTTAAESAVTLYLNAVTGIPPVDVATVVPGWTNAADVTLSEDTNRAAANNAVSTLVAIAKAKIAAAHRGHSVSATVPLHSGIDVDKTIGVQTSQVDAQGKVRRLRHRLNFKAGTAVTWFELAISSVAGLGTSHPEDATDYVEATTATTTTATTAPVIVFHNGETDDHTLTITFPGVEEAERAKATPALTSTVAAAIPEDVFTVML